MTDTSQIQVIVPTLKRRLSGVTATVLRLLPRQAPLIGIAAAGWLRPQGVPFLPLRRIATLPNDRPRLWHARRNTEMLAGLVLRRLFRRRLKLLFTSAAQRRHTGYTRWLIARMDAVVATSPQAASFLDRPAQVIPHGIDTALFRPPKDRTALRRDLALPEDAVLIGCFGRIRPQKGIDLLVEAALATLPNHPNAQVIFTGRATGQNQRYLAALQSRIEQAGLTARIRFLGEIGWDALIRHYKALDLYVAPARHEGFGLTPIEAMACGVPVIAGRGVGAFDAQVADGETGLMIPPDDAGALAQALETLLSDPARRAAMSAAARARVTEHFDIDTEARALVALYRSLLD